MTKPKSIAQRSPVPRLKYTPELADEICRLIAEGKSLATIADMDGMPSYRTMMDWVQMSPDFAQRYARACQDRAERYAEEIVAIADTEPDPQRAKVRVDARKWVAAKLLPKKYGDRVAVDANVSGTITQKHEVNWDQIPTEKLERLRLAWREAVENVIEGEVVEGEDE